MEEGYGCSIFWASSFVFCKLSYALFFIDLWDPHPWFVHGWLHDDVLRYLPVSDASRGRKTTLSTTTDGRYTQR